MDGTLLCHNVHVPAFSTGSLFVFNTVRKLVLYNLQDLSVYRRRLVANVASEAIHLCVVLLHLPVPSSICFPHSLSRLLSPFFATDTAACSDCAYTCMK